MKHIVFLHILSKTLQQQECLQKTFTTTQYVYHLEDFLNCIVRYLSFLSRGLYYLSFYMLGLTIDGYVILTALGHRHGPTFVRGIALSSIKQRKRGRICITYRILITAVSLFLSKTD